MGSVEQGENKWRVAVSGRPFWSTVYGPTLLGLLVMGQAACQTTTPAQSSSKEKDTYTARDYLPLSVGNSWTYQVSPSPEGQEKDTVKIVSLDEEGFYLDDHGGRLQIRSNGIFDGDRFLLEDPLEIDHDWIAVPSPSSVEKYTIEETHRSVSVPAGNFSNCVVVKGEQPGRSADGRKMKVIMRWVYAPHVGLVELRQWVQLKDEKPRLLLERRLTAFELSEPAQGASR